MNKNTKTKAKSIASWSVASILAVVWLGVAFLPFLFMVLSAFKEQFEMLTSGVFSLPKEWNFANFISVLEPGGNFWLFFRNSVIVLAVSLIVLLFISACASYPLSRFKFKLAKPIYGAIVAVMSVPMHVTLIPVFQMSKSWGTYDTLWALFFPAVAFATPISVFILTSFMSGIPKELEEAAEIDGCGKYRTFFQIILPLSKAGLSTLAIYNGVNIWNEFSFANTLTQSDAAKTLPLAIQAYSGQYSMNTPMIMAVLSLTVLPMIIMFIVFQDKLVKGMMAGAVKG